MPSLFVVLTGLIEVQSVGIWVLHGGLSPGIFDAQEKGYNENLRDLGLLEPHSVT